MLIHLVLLHSADKAKIGAAELAMKRGADGYCQPRPFVWLIASRDDAETWRSLLQGEGVDVVVATLSGAMAVGGAHPAWGWLRSARAACR